MLNFSDFYILVIRLHLIFEAMIFDVEMRHFRLISKTCRQPIHQQLSLLQVPKCLNVEFNRNSDAIQTVLIPCKIVEIH